MTQKILESVSLDSVDINVNGSRPWYPPVPEGFGDWIEWERGTWPKCKPDDVVACLVSYERASKEYEHQYWAARDEYWSKKSTIVAYCIKTGGA